MTESNSDTTQTGRTAGDKLVDLLIAYRNWVGVGMLLGAALVVAIALNLIGWSYTGIPDLPLAAKVGIIATIIFAVLGVFLGVLIGRLIPQTYDHLIVSLGTSEDSDFAIWGANEPGFQEITWEKDAHEYPTPAGGWRVWEAVDVDPDAMVARGTWRGSASQRELAQNQAMIEYAINTMEAQAQRGEYVWMNRGPLLREALRRYTRKLNSAYERSTLPGTGELEDVFSDVADGLEDVADEDDRDRPDPVQGVTVNVNGADATAAATDGGTDE